MRHIFINVYRLRWGIHGTDNKLIESHDTTETTLTHSSSSRPGGRLRPSSICRHPDLSPAIRSAFVHDVIPIFTLSLSIDLLQVSLGLPPFLLPSGVQLRATLTLELASLLKMWPSHLHRLSVTSWDIWVVPVLEYRSLLDILLGQNTPKILFRPFNKIFSFFFRQRI